MATADLSLKDVMNQNIDDIDLIIRLLAEIMTIPKTARTTTQSENIVQLVQLMKAKEAQLKKNIKYGRQSEEHAERQKVVEKLQAEVGRSDADVAKLQKCLKDIETNLITAIFQANQKLKSINTANHRKVSAEELIRYAHKISASNSVAAPDTWQQGDPQRPYPTEKEMRAGILARLTTPGGFDGLVPGTAAAGAPQSDFGGSGLSHIALQLGHHVTDMGRSANYMQQQSFAGPMHGFAGQTLGAALSGPQGFSQSVHSLMQFGTPGLGSHGSAPSTPTQPLANLAAWGSPRHSFPIAAQTPPQFPPGSMGVGGQSHISPRVRIQLHPGSGHMISPMAAGMVMQGNVGQPGTFGQGQLVSPHRGFVAPSVLGPSTSGQLRAPQNIPMGIVGSPVVSPFQQQQQQHMSPMLRQQLGGYQQQQPQMAPPMVPGSSGNIGGSQSFASGTTFTHAGMTASVKIESSAATVMEAVELLSSDSSSSSSDETP